jgi:hypothetical protein
LLEDWWLAPMAKAIQTMREVAFVNAVTIAAEIGERAIDPLGRELAARQ